MGLKEKITSVFSSEKEELEVDYTEAPEEFRQRKSSELENARERKHNLVEKSHDLAERIEDSLEEVKDYKDVDGLKAVEDVAESFYTSRKRLLEDLEFSKDLENHLADLEEFLQDFNDVSRKEGVVMKRVEKKSGRLSRVLQQAVEHRDEIEEFVENGYSNVLKLQELEQEVEEIRESGKKIGELEEKLENPSIEEREEKINELKEKISELRESEEWQERKRLESKKEKLEEEKDQKISDIKREISKLDRGLKKAIYAVENEDTGFSGDLGKLKSLQDGKFRGNTDVTDELEQIFKVIEENSLLGKRQRKKFSSAVDNLSDLEKQVQEIDVLEEEIGEVREKLRETEVEEELESLNRELESARKDLEEREDEIEEVREELENLKESRQEKISGLERSLGRKLNADVTLEET